MYKQETILYEDTYNIHITKDYVDNILIEEIHYDNNNRITYKNNDECEVKTFYDINTIHYEIIMYKDINKENRIRKITQETKNFGTEKHYIIDKATCTQLCTYNNNDAILYIKDFIKKQILKKFKLI
jgi:hypothetical protein